jgi:lincosamide nucleotidyltransferase A/C/D/E
MSGVIVVEGRRPVGLSRGRCPGGRVEPLSLSSVLLGLVAVIVVIKFVEFVSGKNRRVRQCAAMTPDSRARWRVASKIASLNFPEVKQRAYRGRQPSAPMDSQTLLAIVDLLEADGIDVWLDGGWGVDALLGQQTREHDDLDLVVELDHARRIIELLEPFGYSLAAGGPPKSFAMVDARGRQVDVHPVTFNAEGGGVYQMDDGKEWVYPAEGFAGRGSVDRRPVRCLSPEAQVLVHAGYELTRKDYRELYLLRQRFGVEPPRALLEDVLAAAQQMNEE